MRKSTAAILVIILASFIIGIYIYPEIPESMPSHWNAAGQVDSYMPRFWGIFLMPLISVGLVLLFVAIPRIDPLKKNIEKFMRYYEALVVLIIAFLFYIYLLTLFWSLGYTFNMVQMMAPALGFLFYFMGIVMDKVKRNWFIGIKTPWTLSSDRVWDKTHKLGAKVFRASGVICLFGILFPLFAIWFILVPVLAGVVYTVAYSYFEYQKLGKKIKDFKPD